ncbi:MAG: DNA mismatch repair protein MutS [Chitinophagaceae bacterium]|nr:DNA mismatch repair protein MutS [Chitinophagaceae bacterium]
MNEYQNLLNRYTDQFERLRRQLRLLSFWRLVAFVLTIVFGYYYFDSSSVIFIVASILCFFIFLFLIRYHDKIKSAHLLTGALVELNRNEIELLGGAVSPYPGGEEYINPHHPYSYDLDLFGSRSLFQYLNRTTMSFGTSKLAESLLSPSAEHIIGRQAAIEELSSTLDFRQYLQANGMVNRNEEKKLNKIRFWLGAPRSFKSKTAYQVLLIFPLAAITLTLLYIITGSQLYSSIAGLLFVINLAISFSFAKKIMSNIAASSDINRTLQQFSLQLGVIEKQQFNADLLKKLKTHIRTDSSSASGAIKQLASLFNYMDIVFNVFISPILNGLFLFHVHVLYRLDRWRDTNGSRLIDWLEVIGEFESLSSLANLKFNNPDYATPDPDLKEGIIVKSMGHPLITPAKRITNDIDLDDQKFVVLTGSNMSGKSTFLRTLGINLILARAGSVVCANEFRFYPYDVNVSMRITDSLQDCESFFYAELKRLEGIIANLSSGRKTFILLDEILRGTNSNDKHSGTVGLIRKLVAMNACGIIATHDLSVGDLATEYPSYIANKCFESEIIDGELIFDYRIKEGVCTKLSASYLMKKLGIIE